MKRNRMFGALAPVMGWLHGMLSACMLYVDDDGTATAIKDLPKLAADMRQKTDEVKALAETITGQMKAGEKLTQETKDKADNALTELNKVRALVQEIEQKIARQTENDKGGQPVKSIGEQFVENEKVKAFLATAGQRGKADMEVKATLTIASGGADGNVGAVNRPMRLPGTLDLPDRTFTVRDLITPGTMDGNSLEYVREVVFNNAAAPVAELARKPESDMRYDVVSTTSRVVAHYMKASRQIMSDAPQLRSTIDGRLLYGLAYAEEGQLLNGDGVGQNLLGIIPQATAFVAPGGLVAATAIDTMRLAMLQAELALFPATGHVMHPIDWARIELLKDAQGRYLIGNPQGTLAPRLWNLPVVTTQAIAQDKFLTGAFRLGAQLFDRWRARVELATENEDDFVKNMVTILAEERLALAVYRPQAFIYGDLGFIA